MMTCNTRGPRPSATVRRCAAVLGLAICVTASCADHTVFVEGCSTTRCPHCAAAAQEMYELCESGAGTFCYVALVTDKNSYAYDRALMELEIQFVPHYFFDGGYDEWIGSGQLPEAYTTRIEASLERTVADVALDVDLAWEDDAFITVTVVITNNEAEAYNGKLRAYVTERVSRWNTMSGEPFHHAMVGDWAFDQTVTIEPGKSEKLDAGWDGNAYGVSDIQPDNILVVAVLFADETGLVDETASATIPGGTPTFIRGDANADCTVNLGDAVYILQNLFANGPAISCLDAADTNDDESVNVADAIYGLQFLFANGPAIPAPHPLCGEDPSGSPSGGPDLPPCEYPVATCCQDGE